MTNPSSGEPTPDRAAASSSPNALDTLGALHATLAHAPIGLLVLSGTLRVISINGALASLLGVSSAGVSGRSAAEALPEAWETLGELCARVLGGQPVANGECLLTAPAGLRGQIACQLSVSRVLHGDELAGLAVLVNNVTDDRRREETLRVRNDLYAMLAHTNQAVATAPSVDALFAQACAIAVESGRFQLAWIGVPDREQDRIRPVATAGEDFGYLSTAIVTLNDRDPRSFGPVGMACRTGERYVVNDFLTSPLTAPWHGLGRAVGFHSCAALPLRKAGEVVAVLTLYSDVVDFFSERLLETLGELTRAIALALERFDHEAARRRNEEALRLRDRALKSLAQGVIISDPRLPDNPIIFASPSIETLTGYAPEEFIGRNCRFLQNGTADPAAVSELRQAIRAGRAVTVELRNFRKDGTPFWNSLALSPVRDERGTLTHFVGVQTDVSARRELEEQLRQAQRMEAMGQLASGIAHDFNNLLTVISGSTEVALELVQPTDPVHGLLEDTQHAGERAAVLTRQLLTFSRRQVGDARVLDLRRLVADTERILRRLLGEDVRLTITTADDVGRIKADEGHVEQVLVNLAVNARDAMPKGGDLRIEIANVQVGDRVPPDVTPVDWVCIRVTDSGTGMDDTTLANIFEPFFTTKPEGKGTGLGLATVRSIVKRAGGEIVVESAVGVGTTFRLYLPSTSDEGLVTVPRGTASSAAPGTETVLIVEDDAAVRSLVVQALRARHYHVLEAGDGLEALAIAAAHAGVIHLIISDVVLPHLGGADFAARIVTARPDCRVLFLSGYSSADLARHGVTTNQVAFLPKPFTPTMMLAKVRDMLDS